MSLLERDRDSYLFSCDRCGRVIREVASLYFGERGEHVDLCDRCLEAETHPNVTSLSLAIRYHMLKCSDYARKSGSEGNGAGTEALDLRDSLQVGGSERARESPRARSPRGRKGRLQHRPHREVPVEPIWGKPLGGEGP
jgi:hypothetical protein